MLSIYSKTSLPVCCTETYKGMTFDGYQYYLTVKCKCEVAVLDCKYCLLKNVKTRRPYTSICYDSKRDCFWATSDKYWSVLFKLDNCLQEVDRLKLNYNDCQSFLPTSISYCCAKGFLIVSSHNKIFEVNPDNGDMNLLKKERGNSLILAVACVSPYIIYCVMREFVTYFILADCAGTILSSEKSIEDLSVKALLLDPCKRAPEGYDLLALTNKHSCYPYLLRIPLGKKISHTLCPCNMSNFSKCENECQPYDKNACDDILESVALEEAAIANILNSEGEKLQKIIAESSDPSELLKANRSVQKTILYATHIEQVLYSKLETIQNICCDCEPEDTKCPSDCDKLKDILWPL